ncbi:hypothetical protein [Nocardiopsis quinghaiensis]|uniref:hypothetical protein n=1 Tax=Nocardiopsis quinghaiensis TaxID=464995 RepID=UPI00123958D8|nr:hypothetical protein [Nocardiopsis quinghaiensis]
MSHHPDSAPGVGEGAGAAPPQEQNPQGAEAFLPQEKSLFPDSTAPDMEGQDPGEHADGPSPHRPDPWGEEGRSRVTNVFYGMVNAQNGVFGPSGTQEAADAPRPSATGRLREREVRGTVDSFVPPDCFDEAHRLLEKQRVLVLTGVAGNGRRSGAISLLDAVGADPIVVFTPSQTLESLSRRELKPGSGYIVLDWFGAGRGESPAEHEYLWSVLRRHVEASDAYLVLTCDRTAHVGATAPGFGWERPRTADVLRRHLAEEFFHARPEAVDLVVRCLPDDHSVADIVAVAERMGAGEDPESAVGHVVRSSSRDRVERWFESGPDRREVADAAALGLLPGVRERDYEILANHLHTCLNRAFPPEGEAAAEEEKATVPQPDPLPAHRGRRGRDGHGLFRVEYRDDGWMVRRFPGFAENGDRTEVLRQLWERYDVAFWDAVRSWAGYATGHRTRRVHLAEGLAALAVTAFDEVHDLYLDRWSRGRGLAGRETCVFALWFMCMEAEHDLAPTVLRTVDRWLTRGTPLQAKAAVQVWSGELGVSYPTEAANRLLDLVLDSDSDHRFEASFAVGALFGSLIDRGVSGRALVGVVGDELAHAYRFSPRRDDREYLLAAAFSILTVPTSEPLVPGPAGAGDPAPDPSEETSERDGHQTPDRSEDGGREDGYDGHGGPGSNGSGGGSGDPDGEPVGGDPAVARHIMLVPDQVLSVAALWAETIRDRRTRRPAIHSLWSTLRALQRNGADAQDNARSLLTDLSRLIPEEEHPGFRVSFTSAVRQQGDEDPFTDAVLDVLTRVFGGYGTASGTGHGSDPGLTKKVTPV